MNSSKKFRLCLDSKREELLEVIMKDELVKIVLKRNVSIVNGPKDNLC
jgi:hypothetical protein